MKILKIEKAVICGLIITILASTLTSFTVFANQCGDIRQKVLRLHILANSDSRADQALKLNIRDRILAESAKLFKTSNSKKQAEVSVSAELPEIQRIAEDEIKKEGYRYGVSARLVHMYFNTRTYGSVTLPAGDYDAVRITIGAAKGHNWWCVLFPPLCLPAAATDENAKTIEDVLAPGEVGIVKSPGKPDVVVKFKVLEWLEEAKDFLTQKL